MRFIFGLMIASCGILTACTQKKEEKAENRSEPRVIYRGVRPDAEKVFQRAKVDCVAREACPETTGLLVQIYPRTLTDTTQTWEVATCTAFFINENTLVTNAHCIPEDLRSGKSQEACAKQLSFSTANDEKFACEKVLDHNVENQDALIGLDLALIRVQKKVKASLPAVATPGDKDLPKDGDKIYVWSVEPPSSIRNARLVKNECRLFLNRLPVSAMTSIEDSVFSFSDCEIHEGNSGSPIFAAKSKKLIGVTQALIKESTMKSLRMEVKDNRRLTFGSSIRCIDFKSLEVRKNDPTCRRQFAFEDLPDMTKMSDEDYNDLVQKFFRDNEEVLRKRMEELKLNEHPFEWTFRNVLYDGARVFSVAAPSCVRSLRPDPTSLKEVHQPSWVLFTHLDSDYRLGLKIGVSKEQTVTFEIIGTDEATETVKLKGSDDLNYDLPVCSS